MLRPLVRPLAIGCFAFALACIFAACQPRRPRTYAPEGTNVRLVADEADAVLAILDARARGATVTEAHWDRLFAAEGYRNLKLREAGMRRPFTDSAFRAFVLSDTLLARRDALHRALTAYRRIDMGASTARALRYLPDGATIRTRVYLQIKPRTNSFVYAVPEGRAIFLYLDPSVSAAVAERDIVTHELHHIGLAQSCTNDEAPSGGRALARRYAGALGEGMAMLAAAGSPDVDPHELSTAEARARWRSDYARWPEDLRRVERFLLDVAEGRLSQPDSIAAAAAPFWGDAQGAWYTVGYAVASTIERGLGRDRLRRVVCDPVALLSAYNEVARTRALPIFAPRLIEALSDGGSATR